MPTYFLSSDVWGAKNRVVIDPSEHANLTTHRDRLFEVLYAEQKIALVIDSYRDFEKTLFDVALGFVLGSVPSWTSVVSDTVRLNQVTINLLSSARLYRDHILKHATDILGPSGLEDLKKEMSEAYDSSFGYRFVEALRNYVQHRGLPITGLNLNNSTKGENDERIFLHIADATLDLEKLRRDKTFKASVLAELDGKASIKLAPAIREAVSGLMQVHRKYRSLVESSIQESGILVKDAISRITSDTTEPICLGQTPDGEKLGSGVPLSLNPVKERETIVEKYPCASGLARKVISTHEIPV